MIHISISAEPIYHIGSFTVTNSMLSTWLTGAILLILALLARRGLGPVPQTKFSNFVGLLIEGLDNMTQSIVGSFKKSRQFFALTSTLFIFIIVSNWIGLLPGVGSIQIQKSMPVKTETTVVDQPKSTGLNHLEPKNKPRHGALVSRETKPSSATANNQPIKRNSEAQLENVPLLRSPSADLNTTLALALIAVIFIQYYAIKNVGLKSYLKKFFNFSSAALFFVGILEIISETAKIISFAFRLFGNIFAGEVLLVVVGSLLPLIGPIPFFALEVFVGLVQAMVFSMLTIVFLSIATEKH